MECFSKTLLSLITNRRTLSVLFPIKCYKVSKHISTSDNLRKELINIFTCCIILTHFYSNKKRSMTKLLYKSCFTSEIVNIFSITKWNQSLDFISYGFTIHICYIFPKKISKNSTSKKCNITLYSCRHTETTSNSGLNIHLRSRLYSRINFTHNCLFFRYFLFVINVYIIIIENNFN